MTLGLPDRATGADEFLVHARWLSDYHRSRSRDVQTRAIALLGFTGVLTALLPNVVAALYDLPGDPSSVSRAALCSTAALLLTTAVCALQALRVRKGPSTSIEDVRQEWRKALDAGLEYDPVTSFTEWLLHGNDSRDSPVEADSKEANQRAGWLAAAASLLTGAVLIVVLLTVLLITKGA